jgi:hypothetical protein
MDLRARAHNLLSSLNEFGAKDDPGTPVANMYDVIVDEAKQALPDDKIIQAVVTGRRSTIGRPMDSAGDMRAVLHQIITALDGS